jgi:ribosomal protein S18 acetylase RimI-like enzyme
MMKEMWTIELTSRRPNRLSAVRELVEEYIRLPDAWAQSGGAPRQLPAPFAEELARLPEPAVPPYGDIAIAVDKSGTAFAVGLLVPYDDGQAEIKRVYVRPPHRRAGVGTALTGALVAVARERGYQSVVLDVMASRRSAARLYERLGFVPIIPYHEHRAVEMRAYRLVL